MSLPSRALIRNEAGELMAEPFVNCGWLVSSVALARSFMYGIVEWNKDLQIGALVDTDTIEMYGEKVTVGFLRSMKDQEQLQKFFEVKWAAQSEIDKQVKEQDDAST